jgi:hypothetical protein
MPLYSYTPELAPKVKSGEKRQTIRSKRKIRPQVGQQAHNYTGGYSTKRQHLGSPVITEVRDILIGGGGVIMDYNSDDVGEYPLTTDYELNEFARSDGFEDWAAMREWFNRNGGLPFEGDLIKWQ